jgi:hypothetical protein
MVGTTPSSFPPMERCVPAPGEHDRAFVELDKALSLDPKYADAYINRGLSSSDAPCRRRAMNGHSRLPCDQSVNADLCRNYR